jgi:hypothetical protein
MASREEKRLPGASGRDHEEQGPKPHPRLPAGKAKSPGAGEEKCGKHERDSHPVEIALAHARQPLHTPAPGPLRTIPSGR